MAAITMPLYEGWKLIEFLAGAYSRGLEAGMSLGEFHDKDPITPIEAYNAGYAQALEDIEQLRGDNDG